MTSRGARPLGDILPEIEDIVELRKALEVKAEKHKMFPSDWVDSHLTEKVQELEGAIPTRYGAGVQILDPHVEDP